MDPLRDEVLVACKQDPVFLSSGPREAFSLNEPRFKTVFWDCLELIKIVEITRWKIKSKWLVEKRVQGVEGGIRSDCELVVVHCGTR